MTTTAPSADELRRMMTDQLTAAGSLHSERWIDAFSCVPRHVFVPKFTVRSQGLCMGTTKLTPCGSRRPTRTPRY